jgi:hypothetical protein
MLTVQGPGEVLPMPKVEDIRLYRPGDEVGITRLFREIFGREMSLREWQWKYHESHPSKVYSSVAVDSQGSIVGHYGGICLPLIYSGRPARGLAICDVMIHPKYRGIKTLIELSAVVPAEAVKDGIIMGYGFPTDSTLLKPALSLGIYEKVEDIFESRKKPAFYSGAFRYKLRLFPMDFSDVRIDELWETCKPDFHLAVVRDRKHMAWRYRDHPLFHYELWGLKKRIGRSLLGMAVLRRNGGQVRIMDFLVTDGFFSSLMRKLENYIIRSEGAEISMWLPHTWSALLVENGFSISPAGTAIPRTTHDRTLTKEDMQGKFFYTMGDADFL